MARRHFAFECMLACGRYEVDPAPCEATLDIDDGKYIDQGPAAPERALLREDNASRIVWREQGEVDSNGIVAECAGWVLQGNTKKIRFDLHNCSDQPKAAELYMRHTNQSFNLATATVEVRFEKFEPSLLSFFPTLNLS